MARRLGIFLCLLGFVAVVVLPLVLNTSRPFGSLNGIEDDIESAAEEILDEAIAVPAGAEGVAVAAEGRDLMVMLPAVVTRDFDQAALTEQLSQIEGVRSVEFGDGIPLLLPGDEPNPDTTTTAEPAAEPTTEPTAEPTAEPAAEPTPEPTAEPTPEPTVDGVDASEAVAELSVLDIVFVPGTATLTAGDTGQLANAAGILRGNVIGGPIEVQSHTSSEGDPDVNLLLSQERAEAIVEFLVTQGVDPAGLTAQGYGASQPLAANDTAEARAQNERVVLVVQGG